MAAYGGGWSGPSRDFLSIYRSPLQEHLASFQGARYGGSPSTARGAGAHVSGAGSEFSGDDGGVPSNLFGQPGILPPGEIPLSDDASQDEIIKRAMTPQSYTVHGDTWHFDPRLALGRQLGAMQATRAVNMQGQQDQQMLEQKAQQDRVNRLVQAGYSQKDAVRQVFGGARTVDEERSLIDARSADQLQKNQVLQTAIATRQAAAQKARADLQTTLEASRSGDRQATLRLRAMQSILNDAERAHSAAVKEQQRNALGYDLGDTTDPGNAQLNAAIDQHLSDVQSTEAGRRGAVAGLSTIANGGGPGATNISPRDAAAFLGVREPLTTSDGTTNAVDPMGKYHTAFQRGTLPNQMGPGEGLKPSNTPKPLSDQQHQDASSDADYRAWLMGKGYDVSKVPRPDDEEESQDFEDGSDGGDDLDNAY